MNQSSFTLSFLVNQTPTEVFHAITNVRSWWSEELEGNSEKLHDEFSYQHGTFHYSKHKLIEVIPNEKVVWLTMDSQLTFVEKQDEWNGTKMVFEIKANETQTELTITHEGLVPEFECYTACSKGWTHYLKNSLLPLIAEGKGKPDLKKE